MNASPQSPWLKLADYGDHPHALGLQRLSRPAAEKIAAQHRSLYGRIKRYFGGVPVYIGHPDDPAFRGQPGHTDSRAYAWIHEVEARDDGLYVLPTWSPKGRELLANAHYKYLSPRWKLKELAKNIYEPVELISVGLTNLPNIQGPAIANARPDGLEPAVSETLQALQKSQRLSEEHLELINAKLELALEKGQIAPCQRDEWQKKLKESPAAANELCGLPRQPKAAHTPFLSDRLTPFQSARVSARAEFIRAVEDRMKKTGEEFATAWSNMKEERRDIFLKLN